MCVHLWACCVRVHVRLQAPSSSKWEVSSFFSPHCDGRGRQGGRGGGTNISPPEICKWDLLTLGTTSILSPPSRENSHFCISIPTISENLCTPTRSVNALACHSSKSCGSFALYTPARARPPNTFGGQFWESGGLTVLHWEKNVFHKACAVLFHAAKRYLTSI